MSKVYIESEKLRIKVHEMISILDQQYADANDRLHKLSKELVVLSERHKENQFEVTMCIEQKSALMTVLSLINEFERR